MTYHDDNVRKVKMLSRDELERLVVKAWDRADDKRLRDKVNDEDLSGADDELSGRLSGSEMARLFEMPTVLDAEVRTEGDDGEPVWKHRDEATVKDHHAFNDRMESLHQRAAGIRRRKREKLDEWTDAQGVEFDHGAPIGEYLWRSVTCAICGKGYRADDPFELAHRVAVALGGGDGTTDHAHRSCNRAEGVG